MFRDRQRIVALIQRYLPPYEPTRLVSHDDIAMLSALPAAQAGQAVGKDVRRPAGPACHERLPARATELGLLHERAAKRMVDEQTFHEEQRALLECMSTARADFPSSPAGKPPPYTPAEPGFAALRSRLSQDPAR